MNSEVGTVHASRKEVVVPVSSVPENYVDHVLRKTKPLPPITRKNWYREINWLFASILISTPIMGLVGACITPLRRETLIWSIVYYYLTGLGMSPMLMASRFC